MKTLHRKCAGLDVHKDTIVACVRIVKGREVHHEVRTFGTMTRHLLELRDWLEVSGCTHVAMEATGVYWKPVWHVLEDDFDLLLANAKDVKAVPGRKTDVNDATWIADLLAHGLIRGGFVPERFVQELRDLTRTRKQFVRERTSHVQRIQKVLEDANIKLASVISDITGMSGRRILEAIIGGQADPEALEALGSTLLKAPRQQIRDALQGTVTDHHRFLLKLYLQEVDRTNSTLEALESKIGECLCPFRDVVERLMTTPGISDATAHVVLAEIGFDMSAFPSSDHLVSWAGLCPRLDESAGRARSTKLRNGNTWLKSALVQAAWAAVRGRRGQPDSYERALYLRLRARRGPKKAIVAVARTLLVAAYFILRDQLEYSPPPQDHFQKTDRERRKRRLVRQLERLGYEVDAKDAA